MAEKMNHLRQLEFFDPDSDYAKVPVHIIGVGGIGSFTAIALAKLGLRDITVWDFDKVEDHNVPNQLHLVKAVGRSKVDSTKALCKELGGVEVKTMDKAWEGEVLDGIVISAVDTQDVRIKLWESVKASVQVKLLIDGRIGGETLRVLSIRPVNDSFQYSWYEEQLFPQAEGAELPCTGRSIIDIGFIIAAIITRNVRRFLKEGEVDHDVFVSMADLTIMKMEVS